MAFRKVPTLFRQTMSSTGLITDLILRMEQKAIAAENLISILKEELALLEKNAAAKSTQNRILSLREENESLRREVEQWKQKLIEAEKQEGIKQIQTPVLQKTETPSIAPKVEKPSEPVKQEKKKKNEGKQTEKAPSNSAASADDDVVDVGRLDLRVGKIVSAQKHPDADSLYVEQVDLGEEKPRTVVSGLVKFISLEDMQNRMAVLMCNLKPAKMRGVTSEAMVMCASTPEKVEILIPPEGSVPGDVVEVEGYKRRPDSVLNPKKKIWETVAPDLKTNSDKLATYKGAVLTVPNKGPIVAPTLTNVQIK